MDFTRGRHGGQTTPAGHHVMSSSSPHGVVPMATYSDLNNMAAARHVERMEQPCHRHSEQQQQQQHSSEPLDLSVKPRDSNNRKYGGSSSTSSPRHSPYTLPGSNTNSSSPRHSPYPPPAPVHGHYSYSQRQLNTSPAYQLPVTATSSSSAPSSYVAPSPFELLTTSNNVINGGMPEVGGIFRPYNMDVDMVDVNNPTGEEQLASSRTPEPHQGHGQGHHHHQQMQQQQQEEEYTKEYTTLEPIHHQTLHHSAGGAGSQANNFGSHCNNSYNMYSSPANDSHPYYLKNQEREIHQHHHQQQQQQQQHSPATTISHKRSSSEPTTMTNSMALSSLMTSSGMEGFAQEENSAAAHHAVSTSRAPQATIPGQGAPPPPPQQSRDPRDVISSSSRCSPAQRNPPPPPLPARSRQSASHVTHSSSSRDQQLDPDSSSDSIKDKVTSQQTKKAGGRSSGSRKEPKSSSSNNKGKSPSPVPSPGSGSGRSKENRKSPIDITQTPSGKQFCDPRHVLGNYDWATLQSKQSLNADLSLIYLQGPTRLSKGPGESRLEERSKVFLSDLLDQTVEICVKMPSPALMAAS